MEKTFLEIKNLYKRFKGVQALEDVSISIRKGELHSIIGENGAGKSTLIKIIAGAVKSDNGEIILDGEDITNWPSIRLFKKGVSASFQENSLFDNLTIAQNIFISELYKYNSFNLKWKKFIDNSKKLLRYFNLEDLNPLTLVSELPPETRQVIEILKSINREVKVLCLDEPTAALTENEIELFFKLLNDLKEKGVTILYISHNLTEVLKLSDRITVLRDGKKVKTLNRSEADKTVLHHLMIGRDIVQRKRRKKLYQNTKPILKVKNISDGLKLKDISFEVYPGEILGLAGLVGSGRTELAWLLFGLSTCKSGEIYYKDEKIDKLTPIKAIKKGIMYLPEDRKLMGLFLGQDLIINTTVSKLDKVSRNILVDFNKEKRLVLEILKNLNVKYTSLNQLVLKLSGGNQQKVLFGKCLFTNPDLLILDEPTKGIDVGSKEEIYELIEKLVNNGLTIILISSEIEEICRLSDRVLVMVNGQIKNVYKGEDINEKDITSCYLQTEKRE